MKRVLILNYEFPPLGGGGGVAAKVLAKGFIQNGYEVDYLTSGFSGFPEFEVVDGINVHRVKVPGRTELATASMISMLAYPVCAFWAGAMLCRKYRYDFINTHFVVPTGPLGWILSLLFRIPNILSIHGGDIYDPTKKLSPHDHWYYRIIVRFLLNRAYRVVAQSTNTKENAERFYDFKKSIEIIPLPYEARTFVPATRLELGLSEDAKYLIGVGRLVKRKGFTTLIDSLALLDDGMSLIIVGEGPERAELERRIAERSLGARVLLAGNVDEERKFQYLSAADVFVLSSVHEGFGIVIQEAMQVGIPIVATNNGGQIDLIHDGVNGLLVPVGDAPAIANAVRTILGREKPMLGDQIGAFSPKAIAREYADLISANHD